MKFEILVSAKQNVINLKKVLSLSQNNNYGFSDLVSILRKFLLEEYGSQALALDIDFDQIMRTFEKPEISRYLKKKALVLEKKLSGGGKEKITNKLEAIFDKLPKWNIKVYLNLIPVSSYSTKNKWMMVYCKQTSKKQLDTILHETNHFIFHKKYLKRIQEKIGPNAFNDIKESFTILTNPEEAGYPMHSRLRKYIKDEFDRGENVDEIIEDLVEGSYLKLINIIKQDGGEPPSC